MWQHALLLPDPKDDWSWATGSLLGLPNLVRVLVTLHRAGIQDVIFPPSSVALYHWLASCRVRADLPGLTWWDSTGWPDETIASTLLGIRGGILVTPQLLHWFHHTLGEAPMGKAYRHDGDRLPVCIAFAPYTLLQHAPRAWTCELLAAQVAAPIVIVPAAISCHTIQELARPGGDRELLSTVGKPTDRRHVEWVRRWTFPVLRWLARARIQPNHVTWSGFGVVLVACWCLAQGSYWSGILGATLLYASWVLDCMDGTLARLTCTESALGQQLDTVLGHLSNLCIFGALIWAVYGAEPVWKGGTVAVFLLGGIEVAQRLSVAEKMLRRHRHASHPSRLHVFLDKINHRDYAVWIFALAVVKGLPIFLWLSLVGVQIYWLLQLWLLRRQV